MEEKQPTEKNPAQKPEAKQSNTLAIVALILAFIIAPIGLILGIIALIKAIKSKNQTSLILSIISLVVGFFGFITWSAIVMVVIQGLSEEQIQNIE